MPYLALWHGGSSYSPSTRFERVDSLRDARRLLEDRRDNWDGSTPCVGEDSVLLLYHVFPNAPRPDPSDYPDARVYFGPRGEIRVEPC